MLLKKIVPAILFCLLSLASYSQGEKVSEYINAYKELAIKEMLRTGVPASITLAQGILESQSGESDLAKRSNNHFGIKCKNDWTGEKVYHDDDEKGECFRSYPDPEQSYIDHSDFLKSRPHYAFLFKLDPTDYEGWAKGLKKAGYATSPAYAQKLIDLITRYDLQDYTLIALNRSKEQPKDMIAFTASSKEEMKAGKKVVHEAVLADTAATMIVEVQKPDPVIPSARVYKASDYPQSPFTINGTRVIFAKEGTSLLALANEFGISYKKLFEFNEMDESKTGDILSSDQLVFLARKAKKGSRDMHTVEPDETLEVIAQKEGVQLEALLAYNRIPKGREPMTGEKIYLKANSPVTPKLVEATTKK
jgi:LysM repeat protein